MHALPSSNDPVKRTIQVCSASPPERDATSARGSEAGVGEGLDPLVDPECHHASPELPVAFGWVDEEEVEVE